MTVIIKKTQTWICQPDSDNKISYTSRLYTESDEDRTQNAEEGDALKDSVARRVAMLERETEDALYAHLECRHQPQRDSLYLIFQKRNREYQEAVALLNILDRPAKND